jgi:uncharacterized membrane protein YoaK (UPF0700 family)
MSAYATDLWRTLFPDPDDRHGPLSPLLVLLTVVTGVVDAFSYLVLGHVFVANMTGNLIFLAFSLAGARGFSAWASGAALVAFAAGALPGGVVAHRRRGHRGRLLSEAMIVELVLCLAALAYSEVAGPLTDVSRLVLIVLLALALGVQNAVVRSLAVPDLTTTVFTLTVTGIAADSRLAGGQSSKIGRRILGIAALVFGGVIGAVVSLKAPRSDVLVIASALLAIVTVAAAVTRRSEHPWTKPT